MFQPALRKKKINKQVRTYYTWDEFKCFSLPCPKISVIFKHHSRASWVIVMPHLHLAELSLTPVSPFHLH